jgi:uridine kinase
MVRHVFAAELLAELERRVGAVSTRRSTRLIGIDGCGGSGKSTLARQLASVLPASVVEFDDFYLPSADRRERARRGDREIGGDFDWRRLRDQVLEPLASGAPCRYRRHDWERDEPGVQATVPASEVVIVEGSYVTRPELRGYFDLTIWVAAPRNLRLERGLERDGEAARGKWLYEWMPEEDRYVAAHRPADRVDIVVDGRGHPQVP